MQYVCMHLLHKYTVVIVSPRSHHDFSDKNSAFRPKALATKTQPLAKSDFSWVERRASWESGLVPCCYDQNSL